MAAPSTRASVHADADVEAFTVLALRYLDDECSAEANRQLKDLLDDAGHRALFVDLCRLHGNLHEAYAAKRANVQQARTGDPRTGDPRTGDPRRETIVQEPSAEDTLHPPSQPPQK